MNKVISKIVVVGTAVTVMEQAVTENGLISN